jgi:hypothetical protein
MRTQTIRLPRHDLYAGRGKPASPYGVNAEDDAPNSNPVGPGWVANATSKTAPPPRVGGNAYTNE